MAGRGLGRQRALASRCIWSLWHLGKQRSHAVAGNGQMLREHLCLWLGKRETSIRVAHRLSAMFATGHFCSEGK